MKLYKIIKYTPISYKLPIKCKIQQLNNHKNITHIAIPIHYGKYFYTLRRIVLSRSKIMDNFVLINVYSPQQTVFIIRNSYPSRSIVGHIIIVSFVNCDKFKMRGTVCSLSLSTKLVLEFY